MFIALLDIAAWLFVAFLAFMAIVYVGGWLLAALVVVGVRAIQGVQWLWQPQGMRAAWKQSPIGMAFATLLVASTVFILAY